MSDELDALKTLAVQDKAIQELNRKLREIPLQLAEARKQLDAEQVVLDELKIPHDTWANDVQQKESTIAIALETIEKFEEHMKQVTTQAEYLNARKQIDEARRLNVRLEDEIAELKGKMEEVAPRLKEVQAHYDNVLESYQSAEAEILKVKDTLEAEIAGYEKVKAEAAEKVEPRTLAYYHRLSNSGRVPALVATVSGICSGCNISLPPQVYNQLIANPARYNTCSHCNRMIYYEPIEVEEAEEKTRSA